MERWSEWKFCKKGEIKEIVSHKIIEDKIDTVHKLQLSNNDAPPDADEEHNSQPLDDDNEQHIEEHRCEGFLDAQAASCNNTTRTLLHHEIAALLLQGFSYDALSCALLYWRKEKRY